MLKGSCHCGNIHWTFDGTPNSATACNCTVCRRYGVLWAYDWQDERIKVSGPTSVYLWDEKSLGFHFCANCGCVAYWRAVNPHDDGRRRIAVNVRMADPDTVGQIPIRHFDGLDSFASLPSDGKCVSDLWA